MIYQEQELEKECMQQVIALLTGAIKTAPKSRGINALKTIVLTEKDIEKVAEQMPQYERPAFIRDAQNIKNADALILVGMETIHLGLDCGMCKYADCTENKNNNGLCIFNIVDLGIALGSAVSSAQILKTDNRIMYTAGYAAKNMDLFEKKYNIVMAIPLKIDKKNIFFDRK